MFRLPILLLATAGLSLAADPAPQRFHLTARAHEIDPRAREHPEIGFVFADKAGKPQDLQHAVVDTRVTPRGQLVIWLMDYKAPLFDRLGDYGLHAIQVHYANKWFGLIPTAARDDGTTLGKLRLEATTGEDFSPLCAIPKPDGMKERALQFVRHLAKTHPAGRWEQFINAAGDDLLWEKVIMSGASHGATSATRFAVHQRVARVVAFCGPRDQHESWQGFPSATPPQRIFGFTHVLDDGWPGNHYPRSWLMLGLNRFGPIMDVDSTTPPYGHSRRLTTRFDVNGDVKRAHSSITPGPASAKDAAGNFLHEAVWRYLFTSPVEETGAPVPPEAPPTSAR
ncbi:MAG: hypothetical protein B9S26_06805 [Opitutia bacterium Tous-C4FEB]|nr:MAG: hypothetical protein B9S26_06805 [Opitutae bacterium Tous-C4FEB]